MKLEHCKKTDTAISLRKTASENALSSSAARYLDLGVQSDCYGDEETPWRCTRRRLKNAE